MHSGRGPNEHARLRALFDTHYEAMLAYARRRTGELADAEEVVADTFVVAWRRLGDLPAAPTQQRPWLYGIARRVILNQRRSLGRRARLQERVRDAAARGEPTASQLSPVMEAMSRLKEADQEILRLVAWEGLSHAEVATAIGVSTNALAIRLYRARRRLRDEMARSTRQAKGLDRIRTYVGWKGSASSPAEREEAP